LRDSAACESSKQSSRLSLSLLPARATLGTANVDLDQFSSQMALPSLPDRTVAGLAHDARNLLSAVHVYCELLAGPGVLAPSFRHYARDLRRIGETGGRLGERLIAAVAAAPTGLAIGSPTISLPSIPRHPFPRINDLAAELLDMKELLTALAGTNVRFEIECVACKGELGISSEDLLRILFNLVANSVEAIRCRAKSCPSRPFPAAGLIRITAQLGGAASFMHHPSGTRAKAETVVLSVRDNGQGIAADYLPNIFEAGVSSRHGLTEGDPRGTAGVQNLPSGLNTGRGLGLSIVRQLVESAGGAVRAVSSPRIGTRFDIELPVLGFGLHRSDSVLSGPTQAQLPIAVDRKPHRRRVAPPSMQQPRASRRRSEAAESQPASLDPSGIHNGKCTPQ